MTKTSSRAKWLSAQIQRKHTKSRKFEILAPKTGALSQKRAPFVLFALTQKVPKKSRLYGNPAILLVISGR
ncbi:MAG: hypothetical protein KDC70_16855, partial [Saprospiraceae bacterium]|nr:hypothetical protein [Saprospiraceae bacterium]